MEKILSCIDKLGELKWLMGRFDSYARDLFLKVIGLKLLIILISMNKICSKKTMSSSYFWLIGYQTDKNHA